MLGPDPVLERATAPSFSLAMHAMVMTRPILSKTYLFLIMCLCEGYAREYGGPGRPEVLDPLELELQLL